MADPHNKNRYGEQWPLTSVRIMQCEIEALSPYVTVSGGWAWCLMSPSHQEYKHAHDLKDIDVFVNPKEFNGFLFAVKLFGYQREKTKYDKLSPFHRYVKYVPVGASTKKIIIDAFIEDVPKVQLLDFCKIVEPSYLLSLYGKHDPDSRLHGSGQCWSVQLAQRLLDNQISPVHHPKMGDFSEWVTK